MLRNTAAGRAAPVSSGTSNDRRSAYCRRFPRKRESGALDSGSAGSLFRPGVMIATARSLIALFLVLQTGAVSPAVPAGGLPKEFKATFMLETGGTTIARIRWSLSPGANGRYISTSHTEPAGTFALFSGETLIERSECAFAGDWLQPLAYHYERTGKKAGSIDITFDWDKNVAQHDSKGAAWRLPVPPGTLDRLNYLVALMRDLMRGERRIEYTVADGGHRLGHYVLAGIGEERIETALGTFDTVVVRRERTDSKRETTLWCARALGFLPVKLVHVERDGAVLTVRIDSLSGIVPSGS